MIIACATDNNYVQHCAVMLLSLKENNNSSFTVYIIYNELSNKNINKLSFLLRSYNIDYNYCKINISILKKAPLSNHITIASYFRILLPFILPTDIKKVLFIDSDIIVNTNLQRLWNIDIKKVALAAVPEPIIGDKLARLNIHKSYNYFNAGVLLINLEKWRYHNISEKIINYINNSFHTLKYHDQDALNANLYDDCLYISSKWNVTHNFYRTTKNELKLSKKQINDIKENPYIIHFTGSSKPWHFKNKHPFKYLYFFYLKKTPWKNYSPIKNYFIHRIQNLYK